MAKYAAKTEFPVLTDPIIRMVDDMVGFQDSMICHNMRRTRAHPTDWKWVKIRGHRRSGFTTTAFKLLQYYPSSLIVYPSQDMLQYARRQAIVERLVPTIGDALHDNYSTGGHSKYLKFDEQMGDGRWFLGRSPNDRHELIILDQASMIEGSRGWENMNRFRDELFMYCDVLVELN